MTMTGAFAVRKARLEIVLVESKQELHGNIHGIFAFNLGTAAVDRSAGQTHVVEKIIHKVDLVLGVDENQGTDRQHAHDQIVQSLLLRAVLDKEKLKL